MKNSLSAELHTIVLWEKALPQFDAVARHLRECDYDAAFIEGSLAPEEQTNFVTRFYFQSQSNFAAKVARVGAGRLMFGVIRDPAPLYGVVNTSRGKRAVNRNMFSLKTQLRQLVKPDDAIHISDSCFEATHNAKLGLGIDLALLDGQPAELRRHNFAPPVIANISDLFSLLNGTLDYVVLRNFEEVHQAAGVNAHGDIDLLVESREQAINLLCASPATNDKTRRLYKIAVGGGERLVDLRTPDENYYDAKWCLDILRRREYNETGRFYVPEQVDLFYSLAYHAFLHKHELSAEYEHKLAALDTQITGRSGKPSSHSSILEELDRFCIRNGYRTVFPDDKTVKFNAAAAVRLKSFIRSDTSRTTPIPEHHARKLIDTLTSHPSLKLTEKKGSASETETYVSSRTQPSLLLKRVKAVDSSAAPFLYQEHLHLQKLGGYKSPRLFFFGIHAGWYVQIMEFLEGWRMDQIKLQPASAAERENMINKLCSEINLIEDALRDRNIVHRDIRPANFIMGKDLQVSVIDFGLAACSFDINPYLPPNAENKCSEKEAFQRLREFVGTTVVAGTRGES